MKTQYVHFCWGGLILGTVVMTCNYLAPRLFRSFNPTATSGLQYWTRNSLQQSQAVSGMSEKQLSKQTIIYGWFVG